MRATHNRLKSTNSAMPETISGVLPNISSSSNKISPVEEAEELPPAGGVSASSGSRADVALGGQHPIEAPSHEEPGESSARPCGVGTAGLSAKGGDTAIGDNKQLEQLHQRGAEDIEHRGDFGAR